MEPKRYPKSEEAYRRASRVMPGGNARTTVYMKPHPIYAARGEGARIWDLDGNEYIDFLNNYAALIHGHCHPEIEEAIARQLKLGVSFAHPTEHEIVLAEMLCDRVPSFDHVRFMNSGTEAVMAAIKAARAYTGRPKIAKIEGAYHGGYDHAEVSLDATPETWGNGDPASVLYARGAPESVRDEVVVLPLNETAWSERILAGHAGELAAILVDPMPNRSGLVPATRDYLQMLRDMATRHGILLIADEIITFRNAYSGMMMEAGVAPDMTTLGKIIGGGLPVGAVAGRAEVMSVFDPSRGGKPPLPHGGTFAANPLTMAAGVASLRLMTPETYSRMNNLGDYARAELSRVFAEAGVPGQVTGKGSILRIVPTAREIRNYRDTVLTAAEKNLMDRLHRCLVDHGILIAPTGMANLSSPMRKAEVNALAAAVRHALRAITGNKTAAR
jgi:glutamate-1-semialdehyde 2,1-aminomutase